jgi:hypothetical protein
VDDDGGEVSSTGASRLRRLVTGGDNDGAGCTPNGDLCSALSGDAVDLISVGTEADCVPSRDELD